MVRGGAGGGLAGPGPGAAWHPRGRGDGFRTFATKKNYQPGRWRVEIETDDGRDIGIIYFDLVNDLSSGARNFFVDRH